MRKWRLALIASTLSLILLMSVSLILHFAAIANNVNAATATYTITVRKSEAVSIYVTGIGVTYDEYSSTTANDIYLCEVDTTFTLTAVNEKKIFIGWELTDNDGNITNKEGSKCDITATKHLTVSAKYRDPVADDFGNYMGDRFVISGVNELVALQHILAKGKNFNASDTTFTINPGTTDSHTYTVLECYGMFLNDVKVKISDTERKAFKELLANEQVSYIKNNDIYEKIRKGYFLIETSFSLFDMGFTGIGSQNLSDTEERYFDGVMCGRNNGENSQIVLVISAIKTQGKGYYGLFGYVGSNAVVRNLKISTSIGVSDPTTGTNPTSDGIYAGAVAGYAEDALLVNLDVTAEVEVGVTKTAEVCAGAIVGKSNGFNVDDISNITNSTHICKVIANTSSKGFVGYLAGYATNTYVKKLNIDNTDLTLEVRNNTDTTSNIGVGGLIGHYENTAQSIIENVHFNGSNSFRIEATLKKGIASSGGLIGHVDSKANLSKANLYIGDVSIKNSSNSESYIASQTLDGNSEANCYVGGLFGKVDGTTLIGNEDFVNGIHKEILGGKTLVEYNPVFGGKITVEAIQNGLSKAYSDDDHVGDCVAGGLVGYGYFDINGTANDSRTQIVLNTEGKLTVSATQTILATHEDEEKGTVYLKHCMAGGIYGIISDTGSSGTNKLENINVYAENIDLSVNREIGSMTMGNMYVGGLISYTDQVDISNISLKYNYGSIESNSLSYMVTCTTDDSNNAHCGGIIGRFANDDLDSKTNYLIKDCVLEGFDSENLENNVGTNIKITSIQNSKAPGDDNYRAENYVGGIVGQIYRTNANGLIYFGSENDIDIIRMAGHENPDSSFCGGVIGFVKNNQPWPSGAIEIQNCKLYNAYVLGEGTNILTTTTNPDMYIGGIIGANYKDPDYNSNNNTATNIDNCSVENSTLEGIANENLTVFIGGLVGGITWRGSSSASITKSHVYNTNISAIANRSSGTSYNKTAAYAAGILGMSSLKLAFKNNAVIDCDIYAECNRNNESYASGILSHNGNNYEFPNGDFDRNYVSGTIEANKSAPLGFYFTTREWSWESFSYVDVQHHINATNCYYTGNIPIKGNGSTSGTKITFTDQVVTSSGNNLGLNTNNFLNGNYAEFDLVFGNNNYSVASDGLSIKYDTTTAYKSDVVEVWINTDETTSSHIDGREGRDAGWFLMGYVNINNNGTEAGSTTNINNTTVHFEREKEEFELQNDSKFHDINNPTNVVDEIGYDYVIRGNNHNITARVHDNIPAIKINFNASTAKFVERFEYKDASNNFVSLTDITEGRVSNYGYYTFVIDTINNSYEFKFYPNVNIEQEVTLRLSFSIGYSGEKDVQQFIITLIPNKLELVGVTYAEYTPPLNYYDKNKSDFGTDKRKWILPENTIIKIIPVFKKSNDIEYIEYIDEKYIEKVTYSSTSGEILSSGELTTPTNGNEGKVTLTTKDGSNISKEIYFITGTDYRVTHSTIGADVDMIPYASPDADYEFIINIQYGYSGLAKNLVVNINGVDYLLFENGVIKNKDGFTFQLYDSTSKEWKTGTITDETIQFRLLISTSKINGDIQMTAEFERVYEISFNLDCGIFNPDCQQMVMTFKVRHNTSFAEFFAKGGTNHNKIMEWVGRNTLYGYRFANFYLVDEANSIQSYGEDLDKLLRNTNYKVTTSLRFYARWNFLIELVEAPGTHIKTSFSSSFMEEVDDKPLINDGYVISVPINHRKGFVFTVIKDDNFLGEAGVKAYVAHKDGEKVITNEITMEKYYEDMYLYFVPPESITGYLIIVSSISNYGFIPGYNTATVTEEIIPEDGVYTFKYVANHKNTANEKSYIYNSGDDTNPTSNLSLNKEFVVRFFKEVYAVNGSEGKISTVERALDKGTVVEVYYQKYVNGVLTSEIVGTTTITEEEGKTEISVYDLYTIDFSKKAFVKETFADALGSAASVSEKYYVSITPPNGLSNDTIKNQKVNYIIEGGYAERKDGELSYVKGVRTDLDFANDPLNKLKNKEDLYPILKETSLQNAIYTVTPSRKTNLTENTENSDSSYTFTDIKTYDVFTLDTVNAKVLGTGPESQLVLSDSNNGTDTIITSKELPFSIAELTLRLGVGIGDVIIRFSEDGTFDNNSPYKIISVNNREFADYIISVDNPTKYKYFQIENISLNEIRLDKLTILSASNAMKYEISEFEIDPEDNTITLTNTLENDIRHDGKTFMLAVQIKKQDGTIVDNIIPKMITLTANGKTSDPIDPIIDCYGRVTAYFNLSELLKDGDTTVDFNINVSSGYTISSVALLEAENALKPAMAEVRCIYTYTS